MENNKTVTGFVVGFCIFWEITALILAIVFRDWGILWGVTLVLVAPLLINLVFFPTVLLVSLIAKIVKKTMKRKMYHNV